MPIEVISGRNDGLVGCYIWNSQRAGLHWCFPYGNVKKACSTVWKRENHHGYFWLGFQVVLIM